MGESPLGYVGFWRSSMVWSELAISSAEILSRQYRTEQESGENLPLPCLCVFGPDRSPVGAWKNCSNGMRLGGATFP